MDISFILPAFVAGVFSFLSPCILPLVPGYLGFISGVSVQDLQDSIKLKSSKRKIFLNGLLFVFGFSIVFIILGTVTGFFGQLLFQYRIWLSRIGGIFIVLFGLHMLNAVKIPFLSRTIQIKNYWLFQKGKSVNSFILGAGFGFGWTPCIGPVLASILALVAVRATAIQGAFLLSIFSFGLAIPFLACAVGIGSASAYIAKFKRTLRFVSILSGLFLFFLGILLFTNKFGVFVARIYKVFDFINYDKLLDYL